MAFAHKLSLGVVNCLSGEYKQGQSSPFVIGSGAESDMGNFSQGMAISGFPPSFSSVPQFSTGNVASEIYFEILNQLTNTYT